MSIHKMFEEICELETTAQTRYCSETKEINDWISFLTFEEQRRLRELYEEYYENSDFVNNINWMSEV